MGGKMPKLTIQGRTFDVEQGTRLVLAIEQNGIRIGHRCGGNARCTTCRVQFEEGEPQGMTKAEYNKLQDANLFGHVRLSCQIVCEHDMTLTPLKTSENQPEWNGDTGPEPAPVVTPEAVWFPEEELRQKITK
jgi:ferredoxin